MVFSREEGEDTVPVLQDENVFEICCTAMWIFWNTVTEVYTLKWLRWKNSCVFFLPRLKFLFTFIKKLIRSFGHQGGAVLPWAPVPSDEDRYFTKESLALMSLVLSSWKVMGCWDSPENDHPNPSPIGYGTGCWLSVRFVGKDSDPVISELSIQILPPSPHFQYGPLS